MTDDDLVKLRLDKAQLGRRGARKSRFIFIALPIAALLRTAGCITLAC